MGRFDRFVTDLARTRLSDVRSVNQYADHGPGSEKNAVRRRNLRLYLEELAALRPTTLLIGEAVSHRGGRLTGIAFVSEALLLAGVPLQNGGTALGEIRGYRKADLTARISTEASATMVWETIRRHEPLPLLWNAFPFHPHQAERPRSNRLPTAVEIAVGAPFIVRLRRLFEIERVIAIGNRASFSLERLGIAHHKVRHPSQGGKRKFVEGMAQLSQRRSA